MSSADDAAAMPPPKSQPHHRSSSSIAHSSRSDAFKRMSMEVATPVSATSTRPNSMITTFTEVPSEVSSPGSRRSLTFEPANTFLTAVAAQERRVLELREELAKAEAELQRLKANWSQQEAAKKRQEVRTHTEAMRPLTSPTKSTPTTEGFPHRTSLSIEEERKKAFFVKPRVPERKVFTGRHTRTLSLLSPDTLANLGSPQSGMQGQASPASESKPGGSIDAMISPESRATGRPHADSKGTRDDLVNTGRQLVGDLREGLWGFWDDLRQATVGDEALREPPTRFSGAVRSPARPNGPSRNNSSSSLKQKTGRYGSRSPHTRSATIAVAPSTPAGKGRQRHNLLGITTEGDIIDGNVDDDDWSNWDSPALKPSAGVAGTDVPSPGASTPQSSVSSNSSSNNREARERKGRKARKDRVGLDSEQAGLHPSTPSGKDAIPWPALQKLSPGNLQRTASHLMKEWERSLTPPAEESERDWIDRYIDGPRKRKGTQVKSTNQREDTD